MKKYNIDPEFKFISVNLPFNRFMLSLSPAALRLMFSATKLPGEVEERKINICSDSKILPLYVFQPKNVKENAPCLLYFHGGGFGYKAAPYHKRLAGIYAKETGCKVVFPDYRLLPKNPYPAARTDAENAFDFIAENSKLLGIDKTKIAVGGDSAGAALAFYVSYCRKSKPKPVFCMLVYPVAGTDSETQSLKEFVSTPLWNSVNNKKMWQMYLRQNETLNCEAMPLLAKIVQDVPAYVETAEFDCLHDEGLLLAQRLRQGGNDVSVNETIGTIHGYDLAMKSKTTKKSVARRIEELKRAFE